jgi:hypothetical protein
VLPKSTRVYKGCTRVVQGIDKGYPRDQQARNPGATPEQPRSNTLATGPWQARWPGARGVLKSVAAGPNPNAENRNPKEIRNPKSRKTSLAGGWPGQRLKPFSDFGLRVSLGFRFSAFGFQGCRSYSSCYRSDFRAAPARACPPYRTLDCRAAPCTLSPARWPGSSERSLRKRA